MKYAFLTFFVEKIWKKQKEQEVKEKFREKSQNIQQVGKIKSPILQVILHDFI